MRRRLICVSLALCSAGLSGCHLPGRPAPGDIVPRPQEVLSFDQLYAQNCAGCHGANGQNGPATDLANPEYEALIDDATLRDVIANGEKGTLMPGFAVSGGGNLTSQQVDVIVSGMRAKWGHGQLPAGQNAPAYKATQAGNAQHGQQVYVSACAQCHGAIGTQPGAAGSILDGSFLALINDQTIRTTIIAGRPDVGQPDWRGDVAGHPLTDADVTDVTAWMLSQRPANPGQPYPNGASGALPAQGFQPTAVARQPPGSAADSRK